MGPGEIRVYASTDEEGRSLIRQAMRQIGLSARGYHRVLKLARTIADLGGEDEIKTVHLAEALQFRPRRWT
jgi:magnesium chelatase family protein